MSSIDGIARAARDNLQSSLLVTHSLTSNPDSPSDFLMNRMNAVLRAVVNSNFDSVSLQEVGELYAAIGEVQPQMVDTAKNLALVNLSRSFAVVIEEAIRQKDNNNNNNSSNGNDNKNGVVPDRNDIKNNCGAKGPTDNGMVPVADSGVAHGESMAQWGVAGGGAAATAVVDGGGVKGVGPSKIAKGFAIAPSPAAPTVPVVDAAAARAARAARAVKEAKKDYSPEATEGRITVFQIPSSVSELWLTAHFMKIGKIEEISYPTEKINGKHKGFAFIKFESNELAEAACKQLNGRELGGAPLKIERAKHWYKNGPVWLP